MKQKHNGGFSLIEVLIAIVLLALIVIPIGSSLVLSHRMNAKTEALMQAQLSVSSAVETLMAEGYSAKTYVEETYGVTVTREGPAAMNASWVEVKVTVTAGGTDISVTTSIRASGGNAS